MVTLLQFTPDMLTKNIFVAAIALLSSSARAELKPLQRVDLSTPAKVRASQASTDAAQAIMRGDYQRAIALADEGLAADPHDPWLHYNKGIALFSTLQTDRAVSELDMAEQSFPVEDLWGRSVAVYQRGLKLQQAMRCRESNQAFQEYASLVRVADPGAARLALNYASTGCIIPSRIASTPALPSERQPVSGQGRDIDQGMQRSPGRDLDLKPMPAVPQPQQ